MVNDPKPEQENATHDPYVGTVYDNILDYFDNVAYTARLYMIPPTVDLGQYANDPTFQSGIDARSDLPGGGTKGGYMHGWYIAPPEQTVILAQTSTTGNQIDNIEIVNVADQGGKPHTTTVNFEIIQPGAATFLDQIISAKVQLGAPAFANDVPLFLEINFKGYTPGDDDTGDGAGYPVTIQGPFRYRLILSTIELEIDEKGSSYQVSCVSEDGLAYNDVFFRLPATITTTGSTITEHIDALREHLSDYRETHNTTYSIKDEIDFDLDGLLSSARGEGYYIADERLVTNNAKRSEAVNRIMNPELLNLTPGEYRDQLGVGLLNVRDIGELDVEVEGDQITFREGVTLDTVFLTILSMNDDFFNELTRTQNPDDTEGEKILDRGKTFTKWYKIQAGWEFLGYDPLRNTYAKKVTYQPTVYRPSGDHIQFHPEENRNLTAQETQQRFDGMRETIMKSYHYIYSGRNDQITDCRIQYNAGHSLLLAPAGGAVGEFSTTQSQTLASNLSPEEQRAADQQASQKKEEEQRKALNDIKKNLGDDDITALGSLLGFSSADVADILENRSGTNARILATVLADSQFNQAINNAQQQQAKYTTSDSYEQIDGGDYLNEPSGYQYSEDIISGATLRDNMDNAVSLAGARQQVADLRRSFARAQEDGDSFDVNNPNPDEAGDNVQSSNFQGMVTNPTESATFDGSPKNTIFGYLMQAHGATDFLVTLDLGIKGDPWYLGPTNTGAEVVRYLAGPVKEKKSNPNNAVYDIDENYILFDLQTPRLFDFNTADEDENTGYWKPQGTSYFVSGCYRLVKVVSSFSNGLFRQELDLNKMPPIRLSQLERTPPQTQVEE